MFRRNSGFKPTMSNSVDAPTPNPRGFTFSEWFVSNPELFDGDKKMSAEEKKLYALMSKLCSWFCINVVFFFVTAVSGSLWLNSSRTVIISTWVAQTWRFSICGTYLIHPCPITTTAMVRRMLVKLHTSSQWSTLLKRRTSLLVTWTLQPFVNRNGFLSALGPRLPTILYGCKAGFWWWGFVCEHARQLFRLHNKILDE